MKALPLLWVAGGIAGGIILQFALLRPIRAAGERRGWYGIAAVARIVSSVIVLWGALAGLYVALDRIVLPPRSQLLVDRIIDALAILSVTWVIARFTASAAAAYGRRTDQRIFTASLSASVIEGLIMIVGILTVLSSFGITIAPLLTTLGLGGLAVALALRDTLANLFAGIQIVAARQIRPGDYVKFDFGAEGEVVDVQWRNTTIRDAQNNVIVVPNEKIAGSYFINYSRSTSAVIVPVTATLPWKGSYSQLETIALQAARETAGSSDGRTSVALTAINETNVQLTAVLDAGRVENRARVSSEFLRRLHDGVVAAKMGA